MKNKNLLNTFLVSFLLSSSNNAFSLSNSLNIPLDLNMKDYLSQISSNLSLMNRYPSFEDSQKSMDIIFQSEDLKENIYDFFEKSSKTYRNKIGEKLPESLEGICYQSLDKDVLGKFFGLGYDKINLSSAYCDKGKTGFSNGDSFYVFGKYNDETLFEIKTTFLKDGLIQLDLNNPYDVKFPLDPFNAQISYMDFILKTSK